MRLGAIELHRDRPPAAEDFAIYDQRIAELAAILHGTPWLLAGALAIPVTLGGFYRRHYDVDVAFPLDAFPRVERAMRAAGY